MPEEAQTVKRIYTRFLAGHGYQQIARDLEADGIPVKPGRTGWSGSVIKGILENERYTGDAICQKTYIENPLTHKVRKNINELPKYLVMNNHPGIIDHSTYQQVQQEIINRRGKGIKTKAEVSPDSSRNALTGRLICGKCGSSLRRTKFRDAYVWRCLGRMEFGVNFCPESETVYERELHTAIMKAIHEMINRNEPGAIVNPGAASDERSDNLVTLNQMKDQIFERMMAVMAQLIEAGGERETPELRRLQAQHEEVLRKIDRKKAEAPSTEEREHGLDSVAPVITSPQQNIALMAYDENMVRQMIESIQVLAQDHIHIIFYGGVETDVMLDTSQRRRQGRPKETSQE